MIQGESEGMQAIVTTQPSEEDKKSQRIERIGRSLMVLYWSAGLLLVLP